jgi:hypothetical protein
VNKVKILNHDDKANNRKYKKMEHLVTTLIAAADGEILGSV